MTSAPEIVERYLLLLLGADSSPIPSILHVQKELFILSKVNPTVQNFLNFEKHYKGPYSQAIQEIIEGPLKYDNAFSIESNGFSLTKKGKDFYNEILKENNNERFKYLLASILLIRKTYDHLAEDELLLLVYLTYPEFTEFSDIYESLNQKSRKKNILDRILQKKLISLDRYQELMRN